jgi:hypothetical protein
MKKGAPKGAFLLESRFSSSFGGFDWGLDIAQFPESPREALSVR